MASIIKREPKPHEREQAFEAVAQAMWTEPPALAGHRPSYLTAAVRVALWELGLSR